MFKKVTPHYDDEVSYEWPRKPKSREEGKSRVIKELNDVKGSIGIPKRRNKPHGSSQASVASLRVILDSEAPLGEPFVDYQKGKNGNEYTRGSDRKDLEEKYKIKGDKTKKGDYKRAKREDAQETLPTTPSIAISIIYFLSILLITIMTVWLILFACSYASMRSDPEITSPSVTLLPPHPLAERYPANCPPNFRYYPNYERVLGMPAPLYSDLHPPYHVVRRYHRAAMKCWHNDKRIRYPFLNDAQYEEIMSMVKDSYTKLMYNSDTDPIWPRFVRDPEKPRFAASEVVLEQSKFWTKAVEISHLSLYDSKCTCTLTSALFPERRSFAPTSNASLEDYCPCTLAAALQVYVWFWKNNLPPMGMFHEWYESSTELSPGTSIFDAIIYAMSKVAMNFWTTEDITQLHKHGWLSTEDLSLHSEFSELEEVLQAFGSAFDQ